MLPTEQVAEDEDSHEARQQKSLFVKNLPPSTTEDEVMSLHNGIQRVKLDVAKNISKTKYALLDFIDDDSAKDALRQITGMELNGHKLYVDYLESSAMISYNQSSFLSQTQDPLKLYVTGFGQNMTDDRMKRLFPTSSGYHLELHPRTRRPVGFAFVYFEDASQAKTVHDSMQETVFDGRVLVVMYAKNDSIMKNGGCHSEMLPVKRSRVDQAEELEEWSDEEEDESDDDDV